MIKFNLRTTGFLFLFLIATSTVFASTYYVNDNSISGDVFCTSVGNNSNDGLSPSTPKLTLANAFAAASANDTILIDKGTYNEINLNLSKAITLIGAGPGNTVFTGNATVNRFASITANDVEIKNVTLRNYYANVDGQVITMSGVTGIIFNNIVVKDNQGNATSGANIAILSGSSATILNSLFSCSGWNSDGGGTLLVNASTLTVNTCVFKDVKNFADYGGAIEIRGAASIVNVTKCTFNECSARRGGAIYQDNGSLIVTESCFINNFTAGDASDPTNGGAAFASNAADGSSCSFTDCSFTNNSVNRDGDQNASSDGGAILFRNANGTFNFDLCSFASNSVSNADKGQDFYFDEAGSGLTGVINNCTFGASAQGSGSNRVNIYNFDLEAADVTLSNSGTPTFTGTAFAGVGTNASSPTSSPSAICSSAALAACGTAIDCNTETNPPVIVSCVEDKTIANVCETALLDYRLEVAAFDDCSFTISQSPAAGTLITTGTTLVTMTVTDQAGNISTCVFNVTLPGTLVSAPIIGTITQPTCTVATGSVDLSGLPASGTWTITPSLGAPFTGSGASTTVNGLAESTTYTFTVTDNGSCTSPPSNDVVINAQPNTAAPTGNGNQTFCSIDNPTVSDLSATGTSIQWYDAPTGGTLLPGATLLTDATHYYATQTLGGCESASRLDVLVSLNNPIAPTGAASQTFCADENPTLDSISITGSSILWYDAASGGSLLPNTTPLVDATSYYASQTLAGCEGTNRLEVTITISDPAAPTGSSSQSFCAINNPIVNDLVAVGSNLTWYDASTGGSVYVGTEALIDGNHYYVSQTVAGCEGSNRLDVTVTISDPTSPTGAASQSFCFIDNPTVNDLIATGTNLIWYDALIGGSAYTGSEALVDGNDYFASQTVAGCESTSRLTVNATVSNPSAPSGAGTQTFCAMDNPTIAELVATGSNLQWYDAPTGGTLLNLTDPLVDGVHYYASQTVGGCEGVNRLDVLVTVSNPAAPSGSNPQPFCPSLNATVADLSPSGAGISWYDAPSGGTLLAGNTLLVDGNHYYASETLAGCEGTSRLDILVNIVDPAAPTGDANQSFCMIDNPTIDDLIAIGSNISWYDANSGGNLLTAGTALVDGNHYYASQFSGGCESVNRLDVLVTLNNPAAPTGNDTQTFCTTDYPTINDLIATGTNLTWYDASSNGNAYTSSEFLIDGWHYYASQEIGGCEGIARFDVTVVLTSPAAPTGEENPEYCFVDSLTLADLNVVGTNLIWYDSNTGGVILPGTTLLLDGTHYYATQTVAGCESYEFLDVMPVINNPEAPLANATQTFCDGEMAQISDLEATGTNIQWYDAASGGNLLLNSENLQDGNQYYASQTVDGCSSSLLTEVEVSILTTSEPTGDTLQYFCQAESPTINDLVCTGENLQWYDEPQNGTLLNNSTLLEHNTFYYATQNVNGCESTEKFTVFVELGSIHVNLVEKIGTLCNESTGAITVSAQNNYGNVTYTWNTGEVGEVISNLSEGTYIVSATDTLGCSAELEVSLTCKMNDIPQIITPGGNGQNETWILNLKPEASVEIYNRWGNKIFEASPYLDNWDGKANTGNSLGNDYLPSGTYYYIIDLKDGEKPLNGFIELVR